MEGLKLVLEWIKAHPTETAALVAVLLELVTRKLPGVLPFLKTLSGLLDKVPGLKNVEGK